MNAPRACRGAYPGSARARCLLVLMAAASSFAARPQKFSLVRPVADGDGHMLLTVDPFRATTDSRVLSSEGPTFLMEAPESGAVISSRSVMARFRIFLPPVSSTERQDESGAVLGSGASVLCLSARLIPTGPRRVLQVQDATAAFHTCLQIALPPGRTNTSSPDMPPFEDLEAQHPIYFMQGDGWYDVQLDLTPGNGPTSTVKATVFACPSVQEENERPKHDAMEGEAAARYFGLNMAVGGTFGWGVAGLNIARVLTGLLKGRGASRWLPVPLRGVEAASLDEETRVWLQPSLRAAARVMSHVIDPALDTQGTQLSQARWSVPVPFPVLHGVGGASSVSQWQGVEYWGTVNVAIVFLENTTLPEDYLNHLQRYDLVLAGSEWLRALLSSKGVASERLGVFWQCVDSTVFHPPHPPAADTGPRFNIFSGGKLEFRKGQDLVVAAMRRFLPHHPDARLLFAWHNPWPDYLRTLSRSRHTSGWPSVQPGGAIDFMTWLASNGLNTTQLVDLGRLEQAQLASLLRESVDVALFPNRCEGGTNLVAMEAAASGVPLLVTRGTGQADLHDMLGGHVLAMDGTVVDDVEGEEGWVEADVDEIVSRLEEVYADRRAAGEMGRKASASLASSCTWEVSVTQLLASMDRLTPPPQHGQP